MSRSDSISSGKPGLRQRLRARNISGRIPDAQFFTPPEPVSVGQNARGMQIAQGHFRFANEVINAPDCSIWSLRPKSAQFSVALHGWTWLDDLVATDMKSAHDLGRQWALEWLERFTNGRGPGWAPDIIGRRLVRMVNHAGHILHKQHADTKRRYMGSIARQVRLLAKEAHTGPEGYAYVEALTGLLHAGYALAEMDEFVDPAIAQIGHAALHCLGQTAVFPSRNPEELLDLFELLTWAMVAIRSANKIPSREHERALDIAAKTLRGLRHADGGLPRFHGSGRGDAGRLDHALWASGARHDIPDVKNLGYTRLKDGRTTIVIDSTRPPTGEAATNAHASTLAFEMTSGRRPIIVNCGCGRVFGADWRRAGRATPSHSTLGIDGYSSSRLDPKLHRLSEIPDTVEAKLSRDGRAKKFEGFHDGYRPSHGLTHIRKLRLSAEGTKLQGEEVLSTTSAADRRQFDEMIKASDEDGLGVSVRFHLHPDVTPQHDTRLDLVHLTLINGDAWIFRHDGTVNLSLQPSVYLDGRRSEPRATKQVVLSGLVLDYAGRVTWSLTKSQPNPDQGRDLKASDSLTI